VWDSNVGVVGHNRTGFFGKLKTLQVGDAVAYATNAGTRTYRVSYVGQIADTDWSLLQYTTDNRLTLITCVENVPSRRVVVQCVEVK
jgi:LPXTG-site transpeptidase (sortase) family protein